jgi:hypothetical protein
MAAVDHLPPDREHAASIHEARRRQHRLKRQQNVELVARFDY